MRSLTPHMHDYQLRWDVLLYRFSHPLRIKRQHIVIISLYGLDALVEK